MSKLLGKVVLIEGVTHIEDLPLEDFINTVETLRDKVVTEKLDGANLWFGVDEKGMFTSREGKSKKNGRFYSVNDYPMVASYNGFRAAHLALEQVKSSILQTLSPGDTVEIEVLFGRQPNTVTYGAEGKNYIVILRGISVDDAKVDALAKALDGKSVTVNSTVISSPDGDKLQFDNESLTWQFTQVSPVDNSDINVDEARDKLEELKKFLGSKNDAFKGKTNREVAEINLGSIEKAQREQMKKERARVLSHIMNEFKLPIKEILLNGLVRKVKSKLQSSDLAPSEDVGVEGVVVRDKDSGDQVKIVDKDVFTAINTFNNFIRGNIAGVVRTDDQDAPIELRGGAFGQAKIRIANLLGLKELALSSGTKRILQKFQGSSPQETAFKLATSLNVQDLMSVKTKISAILKNAVEDVNEILEKFKSEVDSYKLKLKTGKEIGISPEVMKRNLTAFAETKRDISQINAAVLKAKTVPELVLALYGRTIQSLFNGSDEVKESFSLLRSLNEDDSVAADAPMGTPAASAPTTTSSALAPVEKRLFKGSKQIIKRARTFVKKNKFQRAGVAEHKSLLQVVEAEIANQFATDVDDSARAQNDIEFNQLRNNVNIGSNVTVLDVNRYLDKAHEINDQVDTVAYGLELDDGSVVKVFVNASQDEGFADALSKMLGEYDDVEEVINLLADQFDIVDVEWPLNQQPVTQDENGVPTDGENKQTVDGADVVDPTVDAQPVVNPVIDLGDTEEHDESPVQVSNVATSSDETPDDSEEAGEGEDDAETDQSGDSMSYDMLGSDDEEDSAQDTSPEDSAPEETVSDDETTDDDEVVGGELATDETPSEDEGAESDGDAAEDETDEDRPKKKKDDESSDSETDIKKESAMTLGQQFKAKLLAEKKAPVKKQGEEEEDSKVDGEEALPVQLQKMLASFPTKGEKAMVVLMWAMGAPLDALVLKKADVRAGVGPCGDLYMKDSQFRMWVKRLTQELQAAQSTSEAALEDELGNVLQRVILEVMQKIGLPESVERMARATLRANIKTRAKLAMANAHIRQYLKIVADLLGIDSATGLPAEAVKEAKSEDDEDFEYSSRDSWTRAARKLDANMWLDGDQDYAQAMSGPKPFKKGETFAIGEWDGEKGIIYNYVKKGYKPKAKAKVGDAAPPVANTAAVAANLADEGSGNEFVDEVMVLAAALGIPQDNLDYRRKQVEMAIRKKRLSIKNASLVLQNMKRLNSMLESK